MDTRERENKDQEWELEERERERDLCLNSLVNFCLSVLQLTSPPHTHTHTVSAHIMESSRIICVFPV